MTNAPVYVDSAQQVIPVTATFLNSNGVATDPATVVITITDPHLTTTTYTYTPAQSDPNNILKDSTGHYHIWLKPFGASPKPPAGLWTYTWTGVGGTVDKGAQALAGSFRILSLDSVTGLNRWYCSREDLKSRLGIDPADTKDDYEIQLAVQTVTDWITQYCGQPFYRLSEVRTFHNGSVWSMDIDPVVSITTLKIDFDGDGIYETTWVQDTDFQLIRYPDSYNPQDMGVARPKNHIRVLASAPNRNPANGGWLPFTYPFTKQDRVQIDAIWGWADVPPNVTTASLILAADLFKAKDAPYGVAGLGEYGLVRVQSNPWVVELLRSYINMRKKVGV